MDLSIKPGYCYSALLLSLACLHPASAKEVWHRAILIEPGSEQRPPYRMTEKRIKRAANDTKTAYWPNNTVVYQITPGTPTTVERLFRQAIAHIENKTALRFIERTSENTYVSVEAFSVGQVDQPVTTDSSTIVCGEADSGMKTDIQRRLAINVHPQCLSLHTMLHELMHTLGFGHEFQRPDRDQYIIVSDARQVPILPELATQRPFDFQSVMLDLPFPTVDPHHQSLIGRHNTLSAGDVQSINLAYPPQASTQPVSIYPTDIVLKPNGEKSVRIFGGSQRLKTINVHNVDWAGRALKWHLTEDPLQPNTQILHLHNTSNKVGDTLVPTLQLQFANGRQQKHMLSVSIIPTQAPTEHADDTRQLVSDGQCLEALDKGHSAWLGSDGLPPNPYRLIHAGSFGLYKLESVQYDQAVGMRSCKNNVPSQHWQYHAGTIRSVAHPGLCLKPMLYRLKNGSEESAFGKPSWVTLQACSSPYTVDDMWIAEQGMLRYVGAPDLALIQANTTVAAERDASVDNPHYRWQWRKLRQD